MDKLHSVGFWGIKELDPGDGNPDMNSGLNTKDDEMVIGLESQEGIAEDGILPSKGECVPDSGGIVADEAMGIKPYLYYYGLSMKIVSWNCRGAANCSFRRNLKGLLRTHNPNRLV